MSNRDEIAKLRENLKNEMFENFCQKKVQKYIKKGWKNEKKYRNKFKEIIFDEKYEKGRNLCMTIGVISTPKGIVKIERHESSFFKRKYFKYSSDKIKERLSEIICDNKLPKDFKLIVVGGYIRGEIIACRRLPNKIVEIRFEIMFL